MSGVRRVARFWIEAEPWSCWPVSPSPVSVQNCNIAEAGRHPWMSSCLNLSLKQDQLEQVARRSALVVSLPFFFFSWCQFGISWVSFIAPLLFILSPGTTKKSSVTFAPSQQVFSHTDRVLPSLLFSRLSSPSSLCLSSYIRCSHSTFIFVVLCIHLCGPSEWQHSHPVCQLHFPDFNVYKLAWGYTSSHHLGHKWWY